MGWNNENCGDADDDYDEVVSCDVMSEGVSYKL